MPFRNITSADIDDVTEDEDYLVPIQPAFERQHQPPSSPTRNNFEFPSLIECLPRQSTPSSMPAQIMLSDDDRDINHYIDAEQKNTSEGVVDEPLITNNIAVNGQEGDVVHTSTEDYSDTENLSEYNTYSFEALISEARIYYGTRKPEFCIQTKRQRTKQIKLFGSDTVAVINFHIWNDRYGYWTFTDAVRDKYIVKHVYGKYHVWEGIEEGLCQEPMAEIVKAKPSRTCENSSSPTPARASTREISTSSLRPRSARQTMPYTMYREQKKFENRGIQLSESQIEDEVLGTPTTRKKTSHKTSWRWTPRSNTPSPMIRWHPDHSSSTRSEVSNTDDAEKGNMLDKFMMRTRFHGFGIAAIPVLLQDCTSHEELFNMIRKKWAFKLKDQSIQYCIVTFSWLDSDKDILLQEYEMDGFDHIMNEIRLASGRAISHRTEVSIEIFAGGSAV